MRSALRLATLSAAFLAVMMLAPASALAGGPGVWTNISRQLGSNADYPGVLRDSKGNLHVLYTITSSTHFQLFQAIVSPSGVLMSDTAVTGTASSMSMDPQIIQTATGYLAAVGGSLGACKGQVCVTTSANGASGWTAPSPATTDSTAVNDSGFDAVFTRVGGKPVPVFAYSGVPPTAITYHVGVGGPDKLLSSNDSGAFMTDVTLVVDQVTGDVWAAWYQWHNGTGHPKDGNYVREIYPAVGTAYKAPSSYEYGTTVDMNSRHLPLAAPSTGGVYLAYCLAYTSLFNFDCGKVVLWKAGPSSSIVTVPGTAAPNGPYSVNRVALSAGPGGRLWVAWAWPNSTPGQYRAVRTNIAKTKFGAVHSINWPKGITGAVDYALACQGSLGPLDLVAELQSTGTTYNFWQTQLLAGLSVGVSPGKWSNLHAQTVTFTITDVGDPVAGAKVTVNGKSGTTSAKGIVRFSFPKGFKSGSYTVQASKVWYLSATATMKVT